MSPAARHALALYLPLLAVGGAAGLVQALARRSPDRRRRRALDLAWILLLLLGAPAWLLAAAALGL